ncbi:MAG: hypothetical protein ACRCSG_02965 [Cellulosilyticaceae bacterium]
MYKNLKNNKTNREIANEVISVMEKMGMYTENITSDNVTRYLGKEIAEDAPISRDKVIVCYLWDLMAAGLGYKSSKISNKCAKQVKKAYKNGLLNIYMSVLTCVLGRLIDVESEYKMILGYVDTTYSSPKMELLRKYIPIPEFNVVKFHAITIVDEKILDLCYYMQYEDKNQNDSIVYGDFPKNSAMYGWEMDIEIAVFVKYFADCSKMSIGDFIENHVDELKEYVNAIEFEKGDEEKTA